MNDTEMNGVTEMNGIAEMNGTAEMNGQREEVKMNGDAHSPTHDIFDGLNGLSGLNGLNGLDGSDRVATLEKRVQKQEDEILVLQSALRDILRRLQEMESSHNKSSLISPNSTVHMSNGKRTTVTTMPPRNRRSTGPPIRVTNSTSPRSSNGSDSVYAPSTPSQRDSSRLTPDPPSRRKASTPQQQQQQPTLTKWASNITVSSGDSQPSLSSKEAAYNTEEGVLRIYIKGRALHFYAPTNFDHAAIHTNPLSKQRLKLEWVYGYRGKDCRSNVHFLPTGEIVYFLASTVVLYNPDEQTQRHYLGHTDDVKCLAVHPDRITIATGQAAGHDRREGRHQCETMNDTAEFLAHVRVWSSVNLNTLRIIGIGSFERAIGCLTFSKTDGGSLLAVVDESNEHTLSVWSWERGQRVGEPARNVADPVLAADFHPMDDNVIVTCGKNHLFFWNLEATGTLTKKVAIFEKHDKPKYVLCFAFAFNGDVVTGDSNGNILVWPRGTFKVAQCIANAHDGGIFSLCVLKDGTLLSGGGKDRRIVAWDMAYQRTGLEAELRETVGPVRTLSQGKGSMILVGTTRNCIMQGTLDLNFSPLVQGHTDELWGLAVHPHQLQFVTCGFDSHLYLWDVLSRTAVRCMDVGEQSQCVTYHPNGDLIAIGTTKGKWLLMDMVEQKVIMEENAGSEIISCIEFSPDGRLLAVASHDNAIYVYQGDEASHRYSRLGRCQGHTSFVTHLDWSEDSTFLQSNSGDHELLFWNGAQLRQVPDASSMRDTRWATQHCTLSFRSSGVWPDGADGTDVNTCDAHGDILASGDDFGKVNLFHYPAAQPKSPCYSYPGHSSHVTCVRFLHDGARLISVGGKDTAVMQWSIVS